MTTDDERRMGPVTDFLAASWDDDTVDLPRLARLMKVPEAELRSAAERGALPIPTWPGEGWSWEMRQFREWYRGGGLGRLATFARQNARS